MTLEAMNLGLFRQLLDKSKAKESDNIDTILSWLVDRRKIARQNFKTQLIALRDVKNWSVQPDTGNIVHDSGEFFFISGVRVDSGNLREVTSWDQPIMAPKSSGVLALLCQNSGGEIKFLLQGRVAPGNIDGVQLAPTIQSTWSNLNQAHGGRKPPLSEYVTEGNKGQLIYSAEQNEEGGPFWEKTNSTRLILINVGGQTIFEKMDGFIWVNLSQIRALALMDNVLSPFVKAIIAPL